ncbi:inositol monophosphatase family protein [Saccharothrix sp.]|uniref:inositol monophosphatase family protein n=1 Tax=Saccharothrix sp. TaxID=1873460 RepID=UPI002810B816|nr:inositol monophosphatase family protein [Saccharothrix sp.]
MLVDGHDGDPLPYLDLLVERMIVQGLAQIRPGDDVVAREYGRGEAARPGRVRWVVEPISGAANLVTGMPACAVSVAAQQDGVTLAAAVADPASGWLWSAARGAGAVLREPVGTEFALWPRHVDRLDQARIATGFSGDRGVRLRQGQVAGRLLTEVRDLRTVGSTALHLCWVASGFVDGFYEHGADPASWAAGALIAEEAGAMVHAPGAPGHDHGVIGDPVFAANRGVATDLVLALRRAGAQTVL